MGDDSFQPDPYVPPKADLGHAALEPDTEARQWAMFAHLAGLAMYVGIPFGNIIGPLIVWMIKREAHPFVDDQGKEALNFHISMTIYLFVAVAAVFIIIGIVLIPIVTIAEIVLTIIGGINAYSGTYYRYPLTIRFIT